MLTTTGNIHIQGEVLYKQAQSDRDMDVAPALIVTKAKRDIESSKRNYTFSATTELLDLHERE